jgi:hypothetical protein
VQAHVIQPLGLGAQVDLDIAQGLAVSQLCKSHCQELVHAGEVLDLVVASVHGGPLREDAKDHTSWNRLSNREQTEMPETQGESLTDDVLI